MLAGAIEAQIARSSSRTFSIGSTGGAACGILHYSTGESVSASVLASAIEAQIACASSSAVSVRGAGRATCGLSVDIGQGGGKDDNFHFILI